MGGPCVSILLDKISDKSEIDTILSMLSQTGNNLDKSMNESTGYEFDIINGTPLNIDYIGNSLPFGVYFGFHEYEKLTEAELRTIHECFSFMPCDEITFFAFCNGKENHKILGQLALLTAEKFNGLINLCGAITPPPFLIDNNVPLADIRTYVQTIGGKVCEVEYEISETRRWIYHVVDCEFLKSWLQHKDFYMIK